MPVSIRDVAKSAGVSLATVSKVLNNAAGAQISLEKRERVRKVAAELGYRPSAIARAMVRKQIDTIGIMLPRGVNTPLSSPFFGALMDGIFQAAADCGQNMMVFTGHTWVDAATSLPIYQDGRCDGLIVLYQLEKQQILPALLDAGIPAVLVNDTYEDPRMSRVDVDSTAGAEEMTSYLIRLGHRRIGFIYGSFRFSWAQLRLQGYEQALREAGISPNPAWIPGRAVDEDSWHKAGIQVEQLMRLPDDQRPTALFCVNDEIAVRTLQVLAAKGVRVPQDISVAGFNDDIMADRQSPPLTTMRQPYSQIGEQAVHLLLQQVKDIDSRGIVAELLPELVVRASTAPPPSSA
ncbi:MAG: LacI family DNA-binding transcriptional regulator [Armatimonadaceae bacterium]